MGRGIWRKTFGVGYTLLEYLAVSMDCLTRRTGFHGFMEPQED